MNIRCKSIDAKLRQLGFEFFDQHEELDEDHTGSENVSYKREPNQIIEYYVDSNLCKIASAGICYSQNFDVDPHRGIERIGFSSIVDAERWLVENVDDVISGKKGVENIWAG